MMTVLENSADPRLDLCDDVTDAALEFVDWFAASKIVVDGEHIPLRAFHGTDSVFTVFQPSSDGVYGPGAYFTKYDGDAATYGKHVVAAFLSIQNPYLADPGEARRARKSEGGTKGWSNALRARGYDGLITRDMAVIVAFGADQVRFVDQCPPIDQIRQVLLERNSVHDPLVADPDAPARRSYRI